MGPVGNGIVRLVLVPELARDWARTVPLLLVKLATDKPKPKLVNPPPVIVKLVGGVAKSMGLGVMELTLGAGRVSLTVSEVVPTRLPLFPPLLLYTFTLTVPALSPGNGPLPPRRSVDHGIVRLVLVPELARDWARTVPLLLVKLATDKPKPKLVNP